MMPESALRRGFESRREAQVLDGWLSSKGTGLQTRQRGLLRWCKSNTILQF